MDVTTLAGKTTLVTGAASGIGRETALAFARRGADLFLCDVDEAGLAETEGRARELGREAFCRRVDVASREEMGAFAEAVHERIPRRLSLRRARRGPLEAPFRFFRLGALLPRERILYYYLSILRRAERQGFPRQRAQTPHEYHVTLSPHLPQARQEMDLLTQAFVEARYSQHVIEPGQARRVRVDWQRVKAALQALKRKPDTVTHNTKDTC